MIELRDESPSSPASRRLWEEYLALVRDRLGESFAPTAEIFARDDDLSGPGAVWLVAYSGGEPVACGGLLRLDATRAEIKRLFVTAPARRRGIGSRVRVELERRAAEAGAVRIRLLTTSVLTEALAMYRSAGYRIVERLRVDGREDFWLEREAAVSPPAAFRGRGSSVP